MSSFISSRIARRARAPLSLLSISLAATGALGFFGCAAGVREFGEGGGGAGGEGGEGGDDTSVSSTGSGTGGGGACVPPSTKCGAACANLQTDPAHCSACNEACPGGANADATCIAGSCAYTCSGLFKDCNGLTNDGCEVDSAKDPENCGACGNACSSLPNSTAVCAGGACGVGSCNPGYDDCDGIAATGCEASLQGDAANCGACGKACGGGMQCLGGMCSVATWPGAGDVWSAGGKLYGKYTWAQASIVNNTRLEGSNFCMAGGGTLARPNSQVEWDEMRNHLPEDSTGWWMDGHNNFICGTATPGTPKAYEHGLMYCPTGTPLLYTGCNCNMSEFGLVAYRFNGATSFDGCMGQGGMQAGYLGVMDEELTYVFPSILGFVCSK